MAKNRGDSRLGYFRVVDLALLASLSALYAVFRIVPTFPMVAVSGATFRAGDIVAPLYGVVLGPALGPAAVVFGTVIGFSVGAPPVFLGLDFLPAATCAAIVGLVTRRRRKEALILNLLVIAVFLMLPFAPGLVQVGTYQVPYVWLHLVGLAMLASPLASRAASALSGDWTSFSGSNSTYYRNQVVATLVLVLIGTLAQHVTGGILTQAVIGLNFNRTPRGFQTWQGFWTFIFWIYPGERALITIFATLLTAPVITLLKISRLTQHLPQMQFVSFPRGKQLRIAPLFSSLDFWPWKKTPVS